MATTSSLITFSGLYVKPSLRSSQAYMPLNPISNNNLRISKLDSSSNKACVLRFNNHVAKRNAFVVYANSLPGVPLPSGPPPSSSPIRSWVLGLIVSLIIPMFTHKLGPLGLLKNRIDNVVQTVEDIAETVEKVAGEVDKIAENIAHDIPEGKLKNLVELVEHVAEDTAKTAGVLDDIIDQVQEAEEQVLDIAATVVQAEAVSKSLTEEAKSQR